MLKTRNLPRASWRSVDELVLAAALIVIGATLVAVGWGTRDPSFIGSTRRSVDPAPDLGASGLAIGVEILPRERWRARRPRSTPAPLGEPRRITVHHQGATTYWDTDLESSARHIRGMQDFHQNSRKWADLAYHFVVDRAGRVWEGRDLRSIGAHAGTRASNRGNIGIVLLGNFEEQEPSLAQRLGLLHLLERLCERFEIPRTQVFTHNEIRKQAGLVGTACPGKHVARVVDEFRAGAGTGF